MAEENLRFALAWFNNDITVLLVVTVDLLVLRNAMHGGGIVCVLVDRHA